MLGANIAFCLALNVAAVRNITQFSLENCLYSWAFQLNTSCVALALMSHCEGRISSFILLPVTLTIKFLVNDLGNSDCFNLELLQYVFNS